MTLGPVIVDEVELALATDDPVVVALMEERAGLVVEAARTRVRDYTGDLGPSIVNEEAQDGALTVQRVGSNNEHAAALHQGTGPGHIPNPNPPYTPNWPKVRAWAEFRGLNPGAVFVHIKQFGTQPHPYLVEGLEEVFGFENVVRRSF